MPIAGVPTGDEPVPGVAYRLAGGETITPVWRNMADGLTFRLGTSRYLKWSPHTAGIDLTVEADRLAWAGAFITVPRILDQGEEADAQWLLTTAIPGRSAVDPYWTARPAVAARAIGAGLRTLHDALPVDGCPFDWGVETRLAGVDDPTRARLSESPPIDRLVVCHGDACAPNTLLDDSGRPVAHVDLGRLGVGDVWADLAIASWSTVWNYGPGYERLVYDAYGVDPDSGRIAYYRELWDAT